MKNIITFITFITIITMNLSPLHANEKNNSNFTSSYTSIDQKDCLTLDSDNLGSIQECEPFNDIKVKVIEGDIRQSISLTRDKKEYDLEFWTTVSAGFSSLGSKIEWRHQIGNPLKLVGMIVRLDVNEDSDDLDNMTSYLVVSKITQETICVVGKIMPEKRQNELAREMLDSVKELPCLTEPK